jgi:cytochrome P450
MGPQFLGSDPVEVAVSLRERYGHVVEIPPVHPGLDTAAYLVTHPDDVQTILQSDPALFRPLTIEGSSAFGRVVTDSIVSLSDDERDAWIARLRQVSPEFNRARVETKVPALTRETLGTLAEFEPGADRPPVTPPRDIDDIVARDEDDPARVWATTPENAVRLLPMTRRLSLRLLGVSLFGPDLRAHEDRVMRAVATLRTAFKRRYLDVVAGTVGSHLPDRLVLPSFLPGVDDGTALRVTTANGRRVETAIDALSTVADELVTRRERAPVGFDDALTAWLTRPDPVTGSPLAPENARNEVVGLLLAGHATLSAALAWAVYLVADHPDVARRLRAEATRSTLFAPIDGPEEGSGNGSRNETHPVGPDDADGPSLLEELGYARQVWQETLRLYPTLPVFGRMTDQRVELGGYDVASDSALLLSPYVTHRDPVFWPAPEQFDPGRFAPDAREGCHPFAHYPFGGGPHACLGRAIATTEAVVALSALFGSYEVELVDDPSAPDPAEVGVDSAINLQPDRDLLVRLTGL